MFVELLEDRRLLSTTPSSETIQLFNTSTALFVENQGQWQDESVRFAFDGPGVNIAFRDQGLEFLLTQREATAQQDSDLVDAVGLPMLADDLHHDPLSDPNYITHTAEFSVSFDGANVVTPVGLSESESRFNYFVGDQANWRADVLGFETVAYQNLYDGIDLHTFGQRDSLKYEFHVAPGANWRQIAVSYDGINGLSIDAEGQLHVATEVGELVDDAPYVYQVIDGQHVAVDGSFVLVNANTYAFEIDGPYDLNHELIIDPNLEWESYLGGSGYDAGYDLAVDIAGNVLVTGDTYSSSWVAGGWDLSHGGVDSGDAFVVKLTTDGAHIWSTYLGGDEWDRGEDIAVDVAGNVLVTGDTRSAGWVSGGWDTNYDVADAFVVKLAADGTHLWSTYLGGGDLEQGFGISADAVGNVLVAGRTSSNGWVSGGWDTHLDGGTDAFVVKLSPEGGHVWSTYVGGANFDWGYGGISVDSVGNALIVGDTESADWVSGGWDTTFKGGVDAFVVKLAGNGDFLWSSYLGGDEWDTATAIAVDAADNVLVTGVTASTGWVSGGWNTNYGGGSWDGFVVKLATNGTHLWSSYLGGGSDDRAGGIAVDAAGNVLVTGGTASTSWVSGGWDVSLDGVGDAFVVKLTANGTHIWSSYLGGSGNEGGGGIVVDAAGSALVTGTTNSSGWVSGGWDTSYGGNTDGFIGKIAGAAAPLTPHVTVITHGWQLIGGQGSDPPSWTMEMAIAILERAGGAGNIFVHDTRSGATYGNWVPLSSLGLADYTWANSNDPTDEIVLVYNWVWDSNDGEDGWLQAAADNLFASVLDMPLGIGGNILNGTLHFIGHSRGAVVNSLVTNLFGYYYPQYVIDQVTSLDPHPIRLGDGAQLIYEAPDADIYTYANVRYADNYYRQYGNYQIENDASFDFDGVAVPGARNIELANYVLNKPNEPPANGQEQGLGGEHSDVHLWYLATIDTSATELEDGSDLPGVQPVQISAYMAANWWQPGVAYSSSAESASGRGNVGFARTRIGGGDRYGFTVTNGHAISAPASSIFNGDFSYGDFNNWEATLPLLPTPDEIPGWERHGGSGGTAANLTSDGQLQLGELFTLNFTSVKHNPLYIPDNVVGLRFEYQITDASADDQLVVSIDDTPVSTIPLNSLLWTSFTVPLDGHFLPRVATIGFSLSYGLTIDSDVYIDNVSFMLGPPSLVGDYNTNNVVDAADYVLWRNSVGRLVAPYQSPDGNGDGTVGQSDYAVWRSHFGARPSQPAVGSSVAEMSLGTTVAATDSSLAMDDFDAMPQVALIQTDSQRAIGFAVIASKMSSVAPMFQPISNYSNVAVLEVAGDDLLLLLATDRAERTLPVATSETDWHDEFEFTDADTGDTTEILDDPFALALAAL